MNLFTEISNSFGKRNFKHVDNILEAIDYSSPTIVIVATLRYSFARRDRLEHWKSSVQKAYDELIKRGEDADKILKGLL